MATGSPDYPEWYASLDESTQRQVDVFIASLIADEERAEYLTTTLISRLLATQGEDRAAGIVQRYRDGRAAEARMTPEAIAEAEDEAQRTAEAVVRRAMGAVPR